MKLDLSAFDADKRYRSVVTLEGCQEMPRWNPSGGDSPPCSPQHAILMAEGFIRLRLAPNPTAAWELQRLELRPLSIFETDAPGFWFWLVIYHLVRRGHSSGVWPYFRLLVGMDGRLVEPVVTEEGSSWGRDERSWESYIQSRA